MISVFTAQKEAREALVKRLFYLIAKRGHTPVGFALKAGITRAAANRWTKGNVNFTMDTLARFATLLEVPLFYLFTEDPIGEVVAVKEVDLPKFSLEWSGRQKSWQLVEEETGTIIKTFRIKDTALSNRRMEKLIVRGIVYVYGLDGELQVMKTYPVGTLKRKNAGSLC